MRLSIVATMVASLFFTEAVSAKALIGPHDPTPHIGSPIPQADHHKSTGQIGFDDSYASYEPGSDPSSPIVTKPPALSPPKLTEPAPTVPEPAPAAEVEIKCGLVKYGDKVFNNEYARSEMGDDWFEASYGDFWPNKQSLFINKYQLDESGNLTGSLTGLSVTDGLVKKDASQAPDLKLYNFPKPPNKSTCSVELVGVAKMSKRVYKCDTLQTKAEQYCPDTGESNCRYKVYYEGNKYLPNGEWHSKNYDSYKSPNCKKGTTQHYYY
jgi:hypothetical protein